MYTVKISRRADRVLFGNEMNLERLLQPPVPASAATLPVVAAATGCQLKFFAKAIHGNLSQQFGGEEMDLSCAHVPSNAPSHRYFTSQQQVVFFKTLHANPGAIESQEVDTLKPVFNRKHIVVELLESYAVVGNGTALLLSTSGSRFKVDVQQLFEASRQPVAFNFESCMNIIAPDFMENDTMKMEDLDCLSKALGELWNANFFQQDLGDHCAEILD